MLAIRLLNRLFLLRPNQRIRIKLSVEQMAPVGAGSPLPRASMRRRHSLGKTGRELGEDRKAAK